MPERSEFFQEHQQEYLNQYEKGNKQMEERLNEGINFGEAIEAEASLPEDLVRSIKFTSFTTKYFRFFLGAEVENRHGEKGYIALCGIDFRGEIYLVNFKKETSKWYTSEELKLVIHPMFGEDEDQEEPHCVRPKTDIIED